MGPLSPSVSLTKTRGVKRHALYSFHLFPLMRYIAHLTSSSLKETYIMNSYLELAQCTRYLYDRIKEENMILYLYYVDDKGDRVLFRSTDERYRYL